MALAHAVNVLLAAAAVLSTATAGRTVLPTAAVPTPLAPLTLTAGIHPFPDDCLIFPTRNYVSFTGFAGQFAGRLSRITLWTNGTSARRELGHADSVMPRGPLCAKTNVEWEVNNPALPLPHDCTGAPTPNRCWKKPTGAFGTPRFTPGNWVTVGIMPAGATTVNPARLTNVCVNKYLGCVASPVVKAAGSTVTLTGTYDAKDPLLTGAHLHFKECRLILGKTSLKRTYGSDIRASAAGRSGKRKAYIPTFLLDPAGPGTWACKFQFTSTTAASDAVAATQVDPHIMCFTNTDAAGNSIGLTTYETEFTQGPVAPCTA